ncbi:MAG TPA: DNA polymerase I [Actinomycetota bacterium]|nr:DNA polymerase I [Actinomycetota bacterium]
MSGSLLLLDGHSLAYRAFFALPTSIQTTAGQITNAVYGFTSMLVKLLGEQKTDRVAVAFDVGAPTIRLAEFTEYKANRSETPGEFRGQVELIREILDVLAVPTLGVPDHEADDVIATLARRAVREGFDVICVTADRDYLQLVQPGIRVLFNRKGVSDYTLYDEAAVHERFGLPPEKLVDYAALRGDPSDNLPGVPGVGEKTASQLIAQFGSVEAMFEHLDELPKRVQKLRPALEEAREQILRNKRLARLVDDLELDFDPAGLRMGEWNEEAIRELFSALQFRVLLDRIMEVRPSLQPVEAAPEIAVSTDVSQLRLDVASSERRFALAWDPVARGIALTDGSADPVWLDDASPYKAMLEDPAIPKVAHDGKEIAVRLARAGITLAGLAFDTQIAAYLLDPAPGRYELADLSVRYLNRELPRAQALENEDQGQLALGMDAGDADAAGVACARAAALLPLAQRLQEDLERSGMASLMRDVEIPLVEVLSDLELTGVAIDTDLLGARSAELGGRITILEQQIAELAEGPFNLNSPPQLRAVLYDRLGLKPSRRTKTGYSTDAATLESLRGQHPIIDALLEYRELTKLRSTYLDALPRLVDPADGRVHATFGQTVVVTGRISTTNPNLQNIPTRTELGRDIRRAFIAGFPDHHLLCADYSQIELRVLAHITGDSGLTEAFARDEDVHAVTAAKVWGFPVDEVPRDLRARAKAINFGLAYGMNKFGLAQRLGITPDEAQEFMDGYFKSFPGVAEFMQQVVKDAYRDGCTTTLLGRRRYLPELQHSNPRVRALGERQALNAPIQGSAADIIKLAMIKCHRELVKSGSRARMVLTVHDELIFEVPVGEGADTTEQVRSLMEQAYPLAVPLKVDAATGANWADAKP